MLSNIFDEPVDKGNLKSVLERQGNVNIFLGDKSINQNIIGCMNINSNRPKRKLDKKRVEKIEKLRQLGLTDQEIVEISELSLEVVQEVEV
ncbi:MAG: hypothetical protein WCO29_12125 [Nostocales cyanobacterium ELA583]|jgi:hypothetical protein